MGNFCIWTILLWCEHHWCEYSEQYSEKRSMSMGTRRTCNGFDLSASQKCADLEAVCRRKFISHKCQLNMTLTTFVWWGFSCNTIASQLSNRSSRPPGEHPTHLACLLLIILRDLVERLVSVTNEILQLPLGLFCFGPAPFAIDLWLVFIVRFVLDFFLFCLENE